MVSFDTLALKAEKGPVLRFGPFALLRVTSEAAASSGHFLSSTIS
jgi:hypothetical protein